MLVFLQNLSCHKANHSFMTVVVQMRIIPPIEELLGGVKPLIPFTYQIRFRIYAAELYPSTYIQDRQREAGGLCVLRFSQSLLENPPIHFPLRRDENNRQVESTFGGTYPHFGHRPLQ